MVAAFWLGAFLLSLGLGFFNAGWSLPLCHFKTLTGIPCATCGGTRACLSLLRGNFGAAFVWNPLVTALLLVGVVVALLRVGLRRSLSLNLSRGERLGMYVLAGGAFAANWLYVILHLSKQLS